MWYWEAANDQFEYSNGLNVLFGRSAEAQHVHYRSLLDSLHAEDRDLFNATMRPCSATNV